MIYSARQCFQRFSTPGPRCASKYSQRPPEGRIAHYSEVDKLYYHMADSVGRWECWEILAVLSKCNAKSMFSWHSCLLSRAAQPSFFATLHGTGQSLDPSTMKADTHMACEFSMFRGRWYAIIVGV